MVSSILALLDLTVHRTDLELKKACKRKDLNAIKSIINQSPDFINEVRWLVWKKSRHYYWYCRWFMIQMEIHCWWRHVLKVGMRLWNISYQIILTSLTSTSKMKLEFSYIFYFFFCNFCSQEGKSALYQAVSKGNANCARALLSHPQINVNLQSNVSFSRSILIFRMTVNLIGGKIRFI